MSYDAPEANAAFAEKNDFPFRLLSDTERAVGPAYGAARAPDEPYPDSPRRVTVLIAPDGTVAQFYEVADIAAHPSEVLAELMAITRSTG